MGALRFLIFHQVEELLPLHTADRIERIHLTCLGPETPRIVESDIYRVDHSMILRCHQLNYETFGHGESGEFFGR